MKSIELKCRFCDVITGVYTLPFAMQDDGNTYTQEDLGIADSRCDAHTEEYGNYSDMQFEVLSVHGATHEDFLSIMRTTHNTKQGFEEALSAMKQRLAENRQDTPIILINKSVDENGVITTHETNNSDNTV